MIDGALVHAFRPLVRVADHDAREAEDRRLLGQRAAVGEHAGGAHLQPDVVEEAERLQELDAAVQVPFVPCPAPRGAGGCAGGSRR